jgi:hypothetical protein
MTSTSAKTVCVVVLALAAACPFRAFADDIFDPEDPSLSQRSEPATTAPAANEGWIGDPEAPARLPSAATSAPTADPTPYRAPPRVSLRYASAAQTDLERQGGREDTFELLNEANLRIAAPLNDRWSLTVEGRLSWWITSGYAGEDSPRISSPDNYQGRFEPVLRDAYVSGRTGSVLWKVGNQLISWGSMDILSPADIIAPQDNRRGIFADNEQSRIAIPAVNATWVHDRLAWQFLVLPFFVANQQALYGSDFAPLRQGSPLNDELPIDLLVSSFDPSIEDDINGALRQTRRPEELARNVQPATRFTSSYGGMDVSAGYFYGFDRVPTLAVADSLIDFGRFAAERDGDLAIDGDTLSAIGPLLDDVQNDVTLVDAGYERSHFVTLDGVRYLGPIGVRWEGAYSPSRTAYVTGPASVRRPWASGAIGLSYESEDKIVVTAEAGYTAFRRHDSDPDYFLASDRQPSYALGAECWLPIRALTDRGHKLSIRAGGTYLAVGQDLIVLPSMRFGTESGWSAEAGVAIFASMDDNRDTIGDVLDWNDAVFKQIEKRW